MAELVAGACLSSFFQVLFGKSLDCLGGKKLDELKIELDIKLNSINIGLEEAEIKQYQKKDVKAWLDKLKHVRYEADQILDEIATDAMLKKMKAESAPVTNFIFGMCPSITPNPFKSRINEVLQNLQPLANDKKEFKLEDGPSASKEGLVSWKPAKTLSTTDLLDESTIYVRDVHKEKLIKFVLEGNNSGNQVPSIISVVGLGGMGKTTLAKLVFNDKEIKEYFELKAWVYVSESFDDVGLTKAILKSFNSPADDEDLNLLQHQLQHLLSGKKYLLVLDDIWNWNGNVECWETLLLPFNHGSSGSKIMVTTREKKVENVLNSKLFDLQQLDESDCWRLFETHAFHGRNKGECAEYESIGKEIVNKCGGLPLAVKTLGQLLRRKFSLLEWRKILEADMGQLSDKDNEVNPMLRLSYHNLPSSNHKLCFAYCSIFPKGCQFGKGELINFWMAEGLLKCHEAYESEEEFGSEIFSDLESISFLQQSLNTKAFTHEHYFVMHDLVNDLAKSVSGEFCMQRKGEVEVIPERTRHIWCSLQLNCVDKLLEPIYEVKGLRSLILNGDKTMLIGSKVQRDLFSKLKCLRMLSFRGCVLIELVDEIRNLKLLRYLDLSDTNIKSLPDAICMLYNLQTLLLHGCKLTELPSNFSKLIDLRHIELSYFIVEDQNGSSVKELEKLNHLHGKIVIRGLGNVIDRADAAKANLTDKKYLEELYMTFDGRREEMDVSVLEALQPNSNLKKLTIENYNGNCFPKWLRDLSNLVSLKLKNCRLCSELPPLGQLACLKELSISHCNGIKTIGEEFYDNNNNSTSHLPFRSLEVLKFKKMDNWEEWVCLEGFPLLKKLCIRKCPELKSVPPQHLPSLQKLEISKCNKLEECLCLERSPLVVNVSIRNCSKLKRAPLTQHLPSLQKLNIYDCEMLEASIPKGDSMIELHLQKCDRILVNGLSTGLKKFIFCENRYTEFSEEQNLINCTVLEVLELDLRGFPSLDLGCYNSLCSLSIKGCDSFSSLPFSLHLFTNLQHLYLYDCPQLESFPRGGLPSKLRTLVIKNCPKLIGSREEWGLFQLNSLIKLDISDHEFENVESFPEENLLPPTLKKLELNNCSKLRIMNNKGFLHLNSLKWIWIINCPSLESLPEEALQQLTSLIWLIIRDCRIIREKYTKEGGERCHTITHIPTVWIDGEHQ